MFTDTVRDLYHRLDALSGKRLAVIARAIRRFDRNRGPEAAATISYYTIFSIFPLLIFTITALSYFIDPEVVIQRLTELTENLPITPEAIIVQVEEVLRARATFNLIAFVGFLWAGSGAFNSLAANLDRAWKKVGQRSMLQHRLIAILMVVLLAMFMFLSIIYTTLIDLSLFFRLFPIDHIPWLQSLAARSLCACLALYPEVQPRLAALPADSLRQGRWLVSILGRSLRQPRLGFGNDGILMVFEQWVGKIRFNLRLAGGDHRLPHLDLPERRDHPSRRLSDRSD